MGSGLSSVACGIWTACGKGDVGSGFWPGGAPLLKLSRVGVVASSAMVREREG